MSKHTGTGRLRLVAAAIGFFAVVIAGVAIAEDLHETPQARFQARGLADSSVSQQNGAFATRVAIEVPRFHGITPQLSVNYNSSAGNGFAGVGWDLSGFSVIERTSPGRGSPQLNGTRTYQLDGEELIGNTELGGTHATLRQSHLRIALATDDSNWKVTRRDGTVMTYLPTFKAGTTTLRWGLSEIRDRNNNVVTYNWACDGSPHLDCYPASVTYGATTITIDKELRPEALTFATGANLGSTRYRLSNITVKVGATPVQRSRHQFVYKPTQSARTERSILAEVRQFGRDNVGELPRLTLAYSETPANFEAPQAMSATAAGWELWNAGRMVATQDFNGDGRQDVLVRGIDRTYLMYANASGFDTPRDTTVVGGLITAQHWWYGAPTFGDFNGDGRTDILLRVYPPYATNQPDPFQAYLLESTGSSFTARNVTNSYGYSLAKWKLAGIQTGDFNGDGCTDLFILNKPTFITPNPDPTTAHILYGDASGGFDNYVDVTRKGDMTPELWRDSGFHIADFNGDGLSDLLLTDGYAVVNSRKIMLAKRGTFGAPDFEDAQSILGQYGMVNQDWNRNVVPGDFNGDGRADLLLQPASSGGTTLLLYSRGGDRASTMFNTKLDLSNQYGMVSSNWWGTPVDPADYDGDGRLDLMVRADNAYVLYSRGNGFKPRVSYTTMHGMTQLKWQNSVVHPGDFDGDGDADLLVNDVVNKGANVFGASGTATDLLTKVSNGYGGVTDVTYKPSSAWTNLNGAPISQTVISLAVSDGRGPAATTKYEYGDAKWDGEERRHLGFGWVKTIDPSGAYEVRDFFQGKEYQVGDLKLSRRFSSTNALMSQSERQMQLKSTKPYLAQVLNSFETEYNGEAVGVRSGTTFGYDGYGNVTSQFDQGNTALSGDERITYTEYAPNATASAYIVDRPARTTVYAGSSTSGTLLRETRVHYDNATVYTVPPVKGNATESLVKLEDRFLTTKRTYDVHGNVDSETTPMGYTSITIWDAAGLYPREQANALDHLTRFTWDDVCDDKATTTDPNGQVTSWEYDNFCRKKKETRPDTGYTTWAYNNFGTVATQHVRESVRASTAAGDEIWKDAYFDGLGRTYKEVGEGAVDGGVRIDRITDTSYDLRGLVASVSAPHGPTETATFTTYAYDALRRPLTVTFADTSKHQYFYGAGYVTTCDELGKPTTRYHDAYGQVTLVREFLNKSCVAKPVGTSGLDMFETRIAYDMLGQRRTVTDAQNNVTTTGFDLAGRMTSRDDPDLGAWTFYYTDDGQMYLQVDAKGSIAGWVSFAHDALGRLIRTSNKMLKPITTYRYDEAGHVNGIGRLTSMSSHESNAWYDYDAMGRVRQEYRMIRYDADLSLRADAANYDYALTTTYDVMGRLQSVKYPTAELVNYTYDGAGRPYSAGSSTGSYVTAATYNARDHLLTRTLGNGVTESFDYDDKRHWGLRYSAAKGATAVHDVEFGRNPRGEVISRKNYLVPTDTWTYEYDDLRRLTEATSTGNLAWSQTFSYDALGRMQAQTGQNESYTYPAPGAAGPAHAPATFNGTTLQYDANGRATYDGARNITWDAFGNATSVTAIDSGAVDTHKYDANHELVATNDVHFFTQYYERDVVKQVGTSYYFFGGKRIARRYNGATHFYHGDQLGSVNAITDSAGTVVLRKVFSPFGRKLYQSGTLVDNFGLAGEHRSSQTGLYDMGARKMSPGRALFMSPDPSDAPDPMRPQSLNRFAYANNSPTNLVDPTGYEAEEPRPETFSPERMNRDFDPSNFGPPPTGFESVIEERAGKIRRRIDEDLQNGSGRPIAITNVEIDTILEDDKRGIRNIEFDYGQKLDDMPWWKFLGIVRGGKGDGTFFPYGKHGVWFSVTGFSGDFSLLNGVRHGSDMNYMYMGMLFSAKGAQPGQLISAITYHNAGQAFLPRRDAAREIRQIATANFWGLYGYGYFDRTRPGLMAPGGGE